MMKHAVQVVTTTAAALMLSVSMAAAQDVPGSPARIGGTWFLTYQSGKSGGRQESHFLINRGYINIRKRLNDRIAGRITPDISVDREGDGEGDLEMRLKYCYVAVGIPELPLLTDSVVEFGLVHRPWIDFEQHINRYRVQRGMFLDRSKVISSGDFGMGLFALLGERIDATHFDDKFAGRWGSVAVGLYNGGGYHAIEQNNNKTLEGRLSLRPLPDVIPGLQVSYHGVRGKGNTAASPDFTIDMAGLTVEERRFVAAATVYSGTGNYRGDMLDASGDAADLDGWSLFGELLFAERTYALFGRLSSFDDSGMTGLDAFKRLILGASWRIRGETKVVADYEAGTRDDWSDAPDEVFQFSVEYNF